MRLGYGVHGIKFWKTNSDVAKAYLKQIHQVSATDIDSNHEYCSKYVRSELTPDLDSLQTAWKSIPELKATLESSSNRAYTRSATEMK